VLDAFAQPQSLVVLGGTSDIARAVVRSLAQRRCRTVVLAGRHAERLAAAREEALTAGATRVAPVLFDAQEPSGAAGTVDECFDAAGDVDMVLMAVGVLSDPTTELDPARTLEIVTAGYTWPATALTRAAARLKAQGYGRLVVLSSAAAVRVRRTNFVYGSAKSGLDAFSLGLGEALRGTGVGVQVVRPGFVRTKMTAGLPAMPLATGPEAVADDVMRGLESGARVVWSPRLLGPAFGVLRNAPEPLWRRLSR
jgi:decaprenylphospho-beta-D-erythro-pentofuranosid-2-ulose 2-reductase